MFKKPDKYHNESDSQFFRMASKRKLASILFVSIEKLKSFDGGKDFYFSFQKQKKSGGYREINAPRDDLKSIQSRIANLLSRIAPPDFLFAPVAGRSYVNYTMNVQGQLGDAPPVPK